MCPPPLVDTATVLIRWHIGCMCTAQYETEEGRELIERSLSRSASEKTQSPRSGDQSTKVA